jgi:phage gp36-like protein
MAYAVMADIIARMPTRDLIELSDPNNLAIQPEPISQAINDASGLIDGYIATRYALPMADPPPILTICCVDIAVYNLQKLRPIRDIKDSRDRYEDWLKFLEKVNKGEVQLGIAADTGKEPTIQPQTISLSPLFQSSYASDVNGIPKNLFNRGSMRGY